MKFKVRDGFVVHHQWLVELPSGKKDVRTSTHYEGETVEFDPAAAFEHLHKLEAADKAAERFLESVVVDIPAPTAAAVDHEAVATAVVAALLKLGVVVKPAEQAAQEEA